MALPKPFVPWEFTEQVYRRVIRLLQQYLHGEEHTHSNSDGSGAFEVVQWEEESNPSTPPSGTAYTYLRFSGGKQQFCIKFDNGTVKIIADDT